MFYRIQDASLPKCTGFVSTKQTPQLSPRDVLPALCVFYMESSKRCRDNLV